MQHFSCTSRVSTQHREFVFFGLNNATLDLSMHIMTYKININKFYSRTGQDLVISSIHIFIYTAAFIYFQNFVRYCICTLDVLLFYVPDDGDLSLQNVKRFHVYWWFMIIYMYIYIYNCVYLLVYVDDYMDELNQDVTITRQACSSFYHDFWISLYSFSGSLFLSTASAFLSTTLHL